MKMTTEGGKPAGMDRKDAIKTAMVCLVLAAGTLALFAPAVTFDFVNYDDQLDVIDNPHVNQGLTLNGLGWAFQAGYGATWQPLTWMSFMVDSQWHGLRAGGFHATNVVLHMFSSVLLFLVLRRMTNAFWRSAAVAALFAWHPQHVEPVAWVAERKGVLSSLFWMLTMWAYVRYAEDFKSHLSKFRIYYMAAVLFFALGLMAKPMLVTLPFVLLLLDWWPLGRMQAGAKQNSHLVLEKIPFFILSGICVVLTGIAQRRGGAMATLAQMPMAVRLLNALLAYFRYVKKMVWPVDLGVIYPLDLKYQGWALLISAGFLVLLIATAVRLRKTRPYWLVGVLWYLGTLIPVIGFVKVGDQAMADRWVYIPSIGLFIIVCWDIYDMARDWRRRELALGTLGLGALAACFILSARQLQYWRNSGVLLRHAIAVTPDNYVAHDIYAAWLRDEGRLDEAQAESEKALQMFPNYPYAHFILANIFFTRGNLTEAEIHLRSALQGFPDRAEMRLGLGRVLLAQHLPDQAAEQFAFVLQKEPANALAHCWMGAAQGAKGQLRQAREHLVEALRLLPSSPDAHHELGVVLQKQGEMGEAIAQYRAALSGRADFPEALNHLAWILATDGRAEFRNGAEAARLAARACLLTHDKDPAVIDTLAAAHAEAGRFDEAIASVEKAHDLAVAQGKSQEAARSQRLLEVFRTRVPWREER